VPVQLNSPADSNTSHPHASQPSGRVENQREAIANAATKITFRVDAFTTIRLTTIAATRPPTKNKKVIRKPNGDTCELTLWVYVTAQARRVAPLRGLTLRVHSGTLAQTMVSGPVAFAL
jgi:hypothetical protein